LRTRWGKLYDKPEEHFQRVRKVHEIAECEPGSNAEYCVLGKLVKKNLRDLNEEKYLVRRNGKKVPEDSKNMLLMYLEDDTGRMLCNINAQRFEKMGRKIVEEAALGEWFAVRGRIPTDFKMLQVEAVKWLREL
jgi:hypothetical protein